jgi:hypothetical protein
MFSNYLFTPFNLMCLLCIETAEKNDIIKITQYVPGSKSGCMESRLQIRINRYASAKLCPSEGSLAKKKHANPYLPGIHIFLFSPGQFEEFLVQAAYFPCLTRHYDIIAVIGIIPPPPHRIPKLAAKVLFLVSNF